MDELIWYEAYKMYDFANHFNNYLWLLDFPLIASCAKERMTGTRRIFPANASIKDWSAFRKEIKQRDLDGTSISMVHISEIILKGYIDDNPEFKDSINDLFFINPFLYGDEKFLSIRYEKMYDFMCFVLKVQKVELKKLKDFIAEHEKEIDKDNAGFCKNLIKTVIKHEIYFKIAFMLGCVYFIFDKEDIDINPYVALFKENNEWVFNNETAMFDELYNAFDKEINSLLNTNSYDKEALLNAHKKAVEARRNYYQKECSAGLNFYLRYID